MSCGAGNKYNGTDELYQLLAGFSSLVTRDRNSFGLFLRSSGQRLFSGLYGKTRLQCLALNLLGQSVVAPTVNTGAIFAGI